MMLVYPQVFECTTWSSVKDLLAKFSTGMLFRGQGDASWPLTTSLERASYGMDREDAEALAAALFSRVVGQYVGGQVPTSRLELYAMMQHYGAPTNLLDWTRSPYVAAYFAFENPARTCSIWIISSEFVVSVGRAATGQDPDEPFPWEKTYDHAVETRTKGVFLVEPHRQHQRMVTQQGTFLAPGNSRFSFADNLQDLVDKSRQITPWSSLPVPMYRIDIPGDRRTEALTELNKMNINHATLFPGLDGFCRSLHVGLHLYTDSFLQRHLATTRPYQQPSGKGL